MPVYTQDLHQPGIGRQHPVLGVVALQSRQMFVIVEGFHDEPDYRERTFAMQANLKNRQKRQAEQENLTSFPQPSAPVPSAP